MARVGRPRLHATATDRTRAYRANKRRAAVAPHVPGSRLAPYPVSERLAGGGSAVAALLQWSRTRLTSPPMITPKPGVATRSGTATMWGWISPLIRPHGWQFPSHPVWGQSTTASPPGGAPGGVGIKSRSSSPPTLPPMSGFGCHWTWRRTITASSGEVACALARKTGSTSTRSSTRRKSP